MHMVLYICHKCVHTHIYVGFGGRRYVSLISCLQTTYLFTHWLSLTPRDWHFPRVNTGVADSQSFCLECVQQTCLSKIASLDSFVLNLRVFLSFTGNSWMSLSLTVFRRYGNPVSLFLSLVPIILDLRTSSLTSRSWILSLFDHDRLTTTTTTCTVPPKTPTPFFGHLTLSDDHLTTPVLIRRLPYLPQRGRRRETGRFSVTLPRIIPLRSLPLYTERPKVEVLVFHLLSSHLNPGSLFSNYWSRGTRTRKPRKHV